MASSFALRTDLVQIPTATNLSDLLCLCDERFLYCTYRTLLDRHPDELGLATYLPRIRSGESKLNIVRDIASSPEAKQLSRDLPGLEQIKPRGLLIRIIARLEPLWFAISSGARTRRELRRIENSLGGSVDRAEARLWSEINHVVHLYGNKTDVHAIIKGPEATDLANLPVRARSFFHRLKAAAYTAVSDTEI